MNNLYSKDRINIYLTNLIGDEVYTPRDCYSGIYKIIIKEDLGLIARIDGITKDKCIVMVDNYYKRFFPDTEESLKIKLLSSMAVWKAKKGIYYIRKMKKIIKMDFDNERWESILKGIKSWAKEI